MASDKMQSKLCERISELEKEIKQLKWEFNEVVKDNDYYQKENEKLKSVCDYNCPVHKLATHNTCLTCPAVRNSPHHNLKDVSEEELQQIIKEAETEMEM